MKLRGHQRTAKILGGAVCLIGALAITSEAQATTTLTSPWGNVQQTIEVGHFAAGGNEWVFWIRNSDGACSFSFLGTGQLNDNYVIVGPSIPANNATMNQLEVVSGNTQWCNFTLTFLNYGGHYLDLVGGTGVDQLFSFGTGDTFESGMAGRDRLWDNRPGATETGGDGDDELYAENNNSVSYYDMGNGNDCLNTFGSFPPASRIQCGSGTDSVVGGFSGIGTACESYPTSCPTFP